MSNIAGTSSVPVVQPAEEDGRTLAESHELVNLRAKQKTLRTKISSTCNAVKTMVTTRKSRRGVKAMLGRAQVHLVEAEKIDGDIMDRLTDEAIKEHQHTKHLDYVQLVTYCEEEVERYLEERADDAASVASAASGHHQQTPSELARQEAAQQRQLAEAQRVAEEARAAADAQRRRLAEVQRAEAEAQRIAEAAEQSVLELQSNRSDVFLSAGSAPFYDQQHIKNWVEETNKALNEEEGAPDDWVDQYLAGKEKPFVIADSNHSSYSTAPKPEVFSGKALDWFGWIELFYASVHHTRMLAGEKLALLKKNLKGDCANIVVGGGEAAYKEALRRLKQEYGRRDVMRAALLQELDSVDIPRGDPAGFKRSADLIRARLFALSQIGEKNNVDIIAGITNRMQINDRLSWNDARGLDLEHRTLNQFGDWMVNRAAAYQNPISIATSQRSGVTENKGRAPGPQGRFRGRNARVHHSTTRPASGKPAEKRTPFCFQCEGQHRLEDCKDFKALSVADRTTFCIRRSLCFMCLIPKHSSRDCYRRKACSSEGCSLYHHPLLHLVTTESSATARTLATQSRPSVAIGAIRLEVIAANGERVPVNLMYDECSTDTFFREGLVRRLGLSGIPQVLHIEGVGGTRTRINSRRVKIQLVATTGDILLLEGSTMPVVANPVPVTDWELLQSRWSHLTDLPLKSSGGRVDVLLGLNHAHLMLVLEARGGEEHEPIASRTKLGWIVRGVVGQDVKPTSVMLAHALSTVVTEEYIPDLAAAMRRFCDTEAYGTEHQSSCLSPENQRAVLQFESGVKKLQIGYQAPILWREGEPQLHNNYPLAANRNHSLIHRFRQDPEYEKRYRAAMQQNFEEGYAVPLTDAEVTEGYPRYYLAHFGVYKNSPGKKIRVVFDAAARYRGRCLNDAICSGPALQNPLPGVLIKFREGEVAWAADIKAMFSRIRLADEDQRYHCFLWPKEDGKLITCKMTRLTFGVNCSPFVAIRTTWKTAEDAGPEHKEIEQAIKKNVYVDDFLGSKRNVDRGIQIASGVKQVLAGGDFHLQGFISNSAQLTSTLQPEGIQDTQLMKIHSFGSEEAEMVLGTAWWPEIDMLGFRVTGLEKVVYTRVGLVSKVASLFDPLGMAAPMTVKAKIKLRELGVKGLKWSDVVVGDDKVWWQQWFKTLEQLKHIEFPRCLFPEEDRIIRYELHTFCDASEEAYAAVTYTRVIYDDGQIIVRLVKASTKLAPIKTLSIPKLELNAALLGARLARFVQSSLTRGINARFFWTDSSTVRNWIRATAAYYQTFVSHRVGEIQTLTEPEEWRFIPGKLNTADAATRSALESEAIPYSWLYGPGLLMDISEKWPLDLPWMAVTEERRNVNVFTAIVPPAPMDWSRVEITSDSIPSLVKLDGEYLELVRRCQQEVYQEELDRIRKGKRLKSSSKLVDCTPILGPDEILRLGGRIGRARLPYDNLHPPLLPGKHTFTRKIITAFHNRLQHLGTDFVLTHVRQHFWVIDGREAVKKIRSCCEYCIKRRAKPGVQLMGELPRCRLDAGTRPFTHTACDYFGPMESAYARNRVAKKWGALFTCLVTRAVYLDLASSLSSDQFLLLLRRFIGLYGKPKTIYSDNGTNFVGAERELREAVELLHLSGEASNFMKKEEIEWHFQPARTPHFGGAHESLVRSTKRALYAALETEKTTFRYPTEDTLRTLLFEIAGLLNSRPLTYASSDPEDLRPLTPNDFLNRAPTADAPAGDFTEAEPRQHYKYLQRAIGEFWRQWNRTYLQSLVARKKWQQVERNLKVGDYVLEVNKTAKRGEWNTGRVVEVFPGDDGLVRAVDVKIGDGVYRRGIQQLCFLERDSAGQSEDLRPASGEDVPATTI